MIPVCKNILPEYTDCFYDFTNPENIVIEEAAAIVKDHNVQDFHSENVCELLHQMCK